MENSFFYNCFAFVAAWIKKFYEVSICARIVNWVMLTADSIWSGSRIRNFIFGEYGGERFLENSVIGKLIGSLFRVFEWTSKIPWESSLIVSAVRDLGKNFIFMSVGVYAQFLLPFVIISRLVCGSTGTLETAIYITLAAFALVCIVIGKSPAVLLRSSFIAKLVCEFFDFDISTLQSETINNPAHKLVAIILGVVFGAASYWLGLLYALFAVVAFLGVAITLYKTEAGIYAAAFLIPLLPTKFISAIVLVTVVSFIIKVVFGGMKIEFKLSDLFVSAYTLLLIYSLFISFIPSNSLFMVFSYVLYILFFFTVKNTIKTRQALFALVSLVIVSAFCVSLIGMVQKFYGINIDIESWIDAEMFEDNLQRVYSTLGNPNVLGEYLVFTIPLTFGALYYFKSLFQKAIAGGMLLVMAGCLLFTLSRGAWLGLIAAMAVFFALRDKRFIWIGLIALVLLIPFIPQTILDRFRSIGDTSDSSTAYRVSIWQSSVKLLLDFWPIGIGLGTNVFMLVFQRYAYSAAYAQHSHNLFLQVMIDTGIIGFILFISFIYIFFKNLLSHFHEQKDGFIKTFSAALAAGMAGYLVQGMTDNTWYNYRIVVFFWLIMALSSVCRTVGRRQLSD